jgi:hypothetical protein
MKMPLENHMVVGLNEDKYFMQEKEEDNIRRYEIIEKRTFYIKAESMDEAQELFDMMSDGLKDIEVKSTTINVEEL